MKPVFQTKFSDNGDHGNCLSAALASIFEVPLSTVPEFQEYGDEWWPKFCKWIETMGFYPLRINTDFIFPGYCLIMGESPRDTKINHQVIYKNGLLVHDPHPSGGGIVNIKEVMLLVPLDPSRGNE